MAISKRCSVARGEIKQDKRRQTLIDNAELARLSKRLVTLDQNVDLDVPVEDLAVHEPDYRKLVAFLKAMEFSTLTRRVGGSGRHRYQPDRAGCEAGVGQGEPPLESHLRPAGEVDRRRRSGGR